MLFRGESSHEPPTACVGRLGIGLSPNGRDFTCQAEPVLVPDSPHDSHGLAHPRLTLAGGVFLLTYAAYDGETYRLCLATSTDLKTWFRHGPLFPEAEANGIEATSGTIFPQPSTDGKYVMYVGAQDLYIATSENLLEWDLQKKPILKRSKCADFASHGIDSGPSPFLTKDGIVVILNGTDRRGHVRVFAALFNAEDPGKCLAQLKKPCLEAQEDWERFGYLPNVLRATGLSLIDDRLNLYYSGADRYIGVATCPVPKNFVPFLEAEGTEEAEPSKDKPKICGV